MLAYLFSQFGPELVRHTAFAVSGLAAGFAGWFIVVRRFRDRPLGLVSRLSLASLLVGLFGLYRSADRWGNEGTPVAPGEESNAKETTTLIAPSVLNPPQSTSFTHWEFRDLENRRVLMVHPPAWLTWTLGESDRAVSLSFGFDPAVYHRNTNGADFILELVGPTQTHAVFQVRLKPVTNPEDQGEKQRIVVLPPFEPGTRLTFRTAGGEANDTAWDWIYLSSFQLLQASSYRAQQYPGFNRYPVRVTGENFALFRDSAGAFLFAEAPGVLEFQLDGKEHEVAFDYGFMPTAYERDGRTNGAIFRLELKSSNGTTRTLFEHYPKPVEHANERGLLTAQVKLPAHRSGERLILSILPGDGNDTSWDHTFLRRVEFK